MVSDMPIATASEVCIGEAWFCTLEQVYFLTLVSSNGIVAPLS